MSQNYPTNFLSSFTTSSHDGIPKNRKVFLLQTTIKVTKLLGNKLR